MSFISIVGCQCKSRMPQRRLPEGSRWLWQAPGGAAWRVKNVDISVVFKGFSGFACMLLLLLMLCALAGAPLELKDGIIDSAMVL